MFIKKLFLAAAVFLLTGTLVYAGQLTKEEAENYYKEGVMAQRASNFFKAEECYQKVLYLDPYEVKWQKFITNNRGIMFVKQGDLDTAEAYFNEALKMDPTYKPAAINLGFIYEKRRSRLESLEYWAKAFELEKLKPADYIIEDSPLADDKNRLFKK